MNLRPHHLLCIQKFTGHGYDAAFTAYMTALVSRLREQPDTAVTLVQGADDLCLYCPHRVGGVCDAEAKTAALDEAVSARCGLSLVETQPWRQCAETARTEILQTDAFHRICACCQWYTLCRRTEAAYGTDESSDSHN